MSDRRFIYVGGVPGAGKTTLCKLLAKHVRNLHYISSGKIKRSEARKRYGISLSDLNQEQSFSINQWFFESLFRQNSEGTYLVDTHYTYPLSDNSFVKLCPECVVLNMDVYVLIESNAIEIANRRIARGRDRDSVSVEFIRRELEVERAEAFRLSRKFCKKLIVFENNADVNVSLSKFKSMLVSSSFFY